MRVLEKRLRYTRREMMKASGAATFGAALVVSGGMVAAPDKAWAVEAKALKPQSMAALIQMARDIYPHDQLADRFYVSSVAAHDAKAAEDDRERREWIDIQNKADGLVYSTERTLEEFAEQCRDTPETRQLLKRFATMTAHALSAKTERSPFTVARRLSFSWSK